LHKKRGKRKTSIRIKIIGEQYRNIYRMLKLSGKEKQILLYLITNCEIYQLTENEALKYIKDKFAKSISRRSYYNHKNQIYKDHDKNLPYFGLFRFHESKQRSKDITSLSLISHRERIIRDGLINENINRDEFSKLDDHKLYLDKMYEKGGSIIKQGEKLLVKMNSKIQVVNRNFKSIPRNATIRKEYIKCGKEFCLCEHGPYYYAYWRDENGKLKKKYIGRNDPREKENGISLNYSNDLENILRNKQNNLEAVLNNKLFPASP
jgi:hypothetical protein